MSLEALLSKPAFRNKIDNHPGSFLEADKGRYHLYLNLGCPRCASVYSVYFLKGLHDAIGISFTAPQEVTIDEERGIKSFVFDGE